MSTIMNKFNDEIVKMALEQVDKQALADKLANTISTQIAKEFSASGAYELDINEWLYEELGNTRTAAGKTYQKAMKGLAKRMADSLLTGE